MMQRKEYRKGEWRVELEGRWRVEKRGNTRKRTGWMKGEEDRRRQDD